MMYMPRQVAICGCAVLLLGGCAIWNDKPVEELAQASESISVAEQTGARQFGSVALENARTKLTAARLAAERGDDDVALRLAREAKLDAELAAAQANRGKAEAALAEIDASIQTLREEIARKQAKEVS